MITELRIHNSLKRKIEKYLRKPLFLHTNNIVLLGEYVRFYFVEFVGAMSQVRVNLRSILEIL